jgi:MerR family mercuric resistance operon transcriptional regulator
VTEYTLSRLARDAGISINVVRDYVLRGLIQPTRRTVSGYGIYDEAALSRLLFIRASFECGIGLDDLGQLCQAVNAENRVETLRCIESLRGHIRQRQLALANVEAKLAEIAAHASEQTLP